MSRWPLHTTNSFLKEYDIHGVWTPPEEEIPIGRGGRHQSQFDLGGAFFDHPHHHHHHHHFESFTFTDPFTLFDSIFGDLLGTRSRHSGTSFGGFYDPFDRFDALERELEEDLLGFGSSRLSVGFGSSGLFGLGGGSLLGPMTMGMLPGPSLQSSSSSSGGSRWISESIMTQSINGVTTTIKKQRDSEVRSHQMLERSIVHREVQGNEYVTKIYGDGRTVHTINGVEQPAQGTLPSTNEPKRISSASARPTANASSQVSSPSRVAYGGPQALSSSSTHRSYRASATSSPPPPYPGPPVGSTSYTAPLPQSSRLSQSNMPASQPYNNNLQTPVAPTQTPQTTATPITSSK